MTATLEHVNITVSNAEATAQWMCRLFDWRIRWQGPSKDGGISVHVGTDAQYVALYQSARPATAGGNSYTSPGGLNHLAVEVGDIAAAETAVKAAGFTPDKHADYAPGLRFYFRDSDNIEYEIVQYG